jgi:hypothetical protein
MLSVFVNSLICHNVLFYGQLQDGNIKKGKNDSCVGLNMKLLKIVKF